MIDKKIARHFVHYSECLYNPLPIYATQIINPFLDLIKDLSQSRYLDKGILDSREILILLNVPLVQNVSISGKYKVALMKFSS